MASTSLVLDIFARDRASSVFKGVGRSSDDLGGKLGGLKRIAGAVGGVVAAGTAFAFLKTSMKEASTEGQGIEVLAKTMRNTVGATDAQTAAVERWVTKMQNATGIMDDQLRPALGKLVISGRSVSQAEKDLGVAADIAAARHADLTTVVQAMSKAALGNVAGLGRLGIATKDAAGHTLTYEQILAKASKTMGGSAAAAADTAAGKAAILKAKFTDLQENIGKALLPIMETLVGALMKVTDWFNNLSPGMQKVVIIAAGLLAVLGPLVAIIGTITSVIGGLSVAMAFLAANPIVLVVAALVALAAGLVFAYKNSETFRDIVNGAFNAVKVVAETVFNAIKTAATVPFNFIKDHWPLLLAILTGPFGLAVLFVTQHFGAIVEFLKSIPGKVASAFSGLASLITAPFGAAFNTIAKLWNSTIGKLQFKIPGWVPGVGGKGFDVPDIPTLAKGGIVTSPTLALIGEAGPEAVIPLTRMNGRSVHVTNNIHAPEVSAAQLLDLADRYTGWRLGLAGGA